VLLLLVLKKVLTVLTSLYYQCVRLIKNSL
jgi:hypothetical protein